MAYSRQWTVTLGREFPQELDGILVTCNYFDVLSVSPAIGPGFTSANCDTSAASPVVVLSHALWKRAFGSDPQILDKPVVLDGRDVTVVGVAPAGFDGIDMAKASFFIPTSMADVLRPELNLVENQDISWLTLIGRRQGDTDIAKVRADLSLAAGRIDAQQPGRTTSLIVEPAAALSLPVARRDVLGASTIAMAAFGLLLLVAAANVANMLLARAAARTREIAIRLSVGATRGRLVQQLLTESAIIAVAGAAAGTLLFSWSFQAIVPWLLTLVPGADAMRIDATPDPSVFLFALALTAATTLLFGLVPALQASKTDVHAVRTQDAADAKARRGWLRGTLIGAQIAFCTILLVSASLLSRAMYVLYTVDPGFDHRNVTMVAIDLRGPRYEQGNAAGFYEQWLERVRALPGVERVAQANRMPFSPGRSQTTIRVGDGPEQLADVNAVSPDFFSLLAMPIVRGRVFTDSEPDAALVTESTARHYWPGQDAIGRLIRVGGMDGRSRSIVGVVRDAQVAVADEAVSSYLYLPATRAAQRRISVLARTRMDAHQFATAVRAETERMDRTLVVRVQPLADNLALMQTLSQVAAGVAGLVCLLALGLAAVGIYGVVAYVVTRRRREVGIRLALGASVRDVGRLILAQTLRPVAIGLAVGMAVAAGAARVLQSVLFGVSPFDPVAYLAAPLVIIVVAALAAWEPTRQALRTDPVTTLRAD